MISGYFMVLSCKRSLSKVLQLFVQLSVFNLLYFAFRIMTGLQPFSWGAMLADMIPINYFVTLYCAVYLVSPYLNILMQKLSENGLRRLMLTTFLIFSVWPAFVDMLEIWVGVGLNGLNSVGIMGSENGCTFVNFFLAYMIGAWIRKRDFRIKATTLCIAALSLIAMLLVCSLIQLKAEQVANPVCWNYNNPLCLLLAAVWLLIFLRFRFSGKIINELASAVFTSVLCHVWFFPYLRIPEIVQAKWWIMLLCLAASCLGLYLAAYFLHKAYSFAADCTIHRLIKKIDQAVPLPAPELRDR